MSHLLDGAILGTIQGLTEFLPVSSSGHLLLAHEFLHYDATNSLTFDVALHVGTFFALVAYFWRDIIVLLKNFIASFSRRPWTPELRLPWLIIVAAIPAAIFGATLDSFFESVRNPWVVISTFIIFGFVFLWVERRKVTEQHDMMSMTWKTALGIGLAQVIALVPGVSRSGITIVAGMMTGLKREAAARFTFLLSIPVVAGAATKKLLDLKSAPPSHDERTAMLVGILFATVVGYAVIRFLLRFLANHKLNVFAYYRFAVAIVAAAVLLMR